MRTPKSLQKIAEKVNGRIEILRFRGYGKVAKGYAIVDSDNNELAEIEPVYYSNGDRWKIAIHNDQNALKRCGLNYSVSYVKSLRGLSLDLTPGHTGFKFSKIEFLLPSNSPLN